MNQYFADTYDETLASEFYNLYLDGHKEALQEFLKLIMPLIRKVSIIYATGCRSHRDYLEANALNTVYDAAVSQVLPGDPKGLFRYLFSVIKNSIARSITKWVNPQVIDLGFACVDYPSGTVGRSHGDVESSIMHEQIQKQVRRTARLNVRFTGVERKACIDIITRMVYGEDYKVDLLRHKYNLTIDKINTLISHASVLVRRGYYELGRDE